MKRIKISMILNLIIFILVLVSTIMMLTGFEFTGKEVPLTTTKISIFKFFTVDSNILVGISSLVLFIREWIYLKNRCAIEEWFYVLKFMGTTSVLLTMVVTACFLAPFSIFHFLDFYQNSNLFFHFIIPVISIISFVCFEKCDIPFQKTLYGIVPMIIYGIFYVIQVFPHIQNGKVSYDYDFYGFLRGGVSTIYIVVPAMLFGTYVLGYGLWLAHKKIQ